MRPIALVSVAAFAALLSTPAGAQIIQCVDPPSPTPAEAACRIDVDATTRELRLVLRLRAANNAPVPGRLVQFQASSGEIRDTATSDAEGYVSVTWVGTLQPEPVVVTAATSFGGVTTRRQIRLARRAASAPAYIKAVEPRGEHSAFANRFLTEDVEVQIIADPTTCNRTTVVFEYLSVGTGAAPEPKLYNSPAMWSETDPNEFGCTARLRWALAPAAGKQTMRAWIKRDSAFVAPQDEAGVQRYLRPHDVRAIAHAQPAFLAGAAVIEGGDTGDSTSIPKLIGIDLSFPTVADLLKHGPLNDAGQLVDRMRFFLGTDFGTRAGKNVYLGIEPLVLLIGPRAADVPIAVVTGRRTGANKDRWFIGGFVNASTLASTVLSGLGIK